MPIVDPLWLQVDTNLRGAGFERRDLESFEFPVVNPVEAADGTQIPTVTFGDVHEAPRIVATTTPYFTELKSAHYLLRLAAMQTALGDEYAVVGAQVFHPADQPLSKGQRKLVASGDFSPFATRQAAVVEGLGLRSHQGLILHGQSMGADVATETAFGNQFNENRGSLPVIGLGAVEAARMVERPFGALGMLRAFGSSGGDLAKNIVEAKVPALNEAWGLPRYATEEQSDKRTGKKVHADIVNYVKAGLADNWAAVRGFATARTFDQLDILLSHSGHPVTAIRSQGSEVFTKQAADELARKHPGHVFEVEGDHSRDDNIRKAAQLVVFIANRSV